MSRKLILILLSLTLTFAFIQVHADSPSDPRAALEQRVNVYLTALKINDLATAYGLESGARDGTLTADEFHRRATQAKALLLDYAIEEVQVEGDSGTVKVKMTYQYPQLHKPYTTERSSQWIILDGQWYYKTPAVR